MEIRKNDKGTFDAYAWPGGYQIIYICADGGILCPDCANGKNGSEASTDKDAPSDWRMEACDIYYEGPILPCSHCNTGIESAYGDPDAVEAK